MSSVSTHHGAGPAAVSPHHLATDAALRIMDAGGTAADAVIATNAVLGMVLPTTCGIGGDLFAIVHRPGWDRPEVLNASGRGGSGLDPARLRTDGHEQIPPYSGAAISVPGCIDGWEALQERHGRLDLAAVIEPAIELGITGFEASIELSDALERLAESLASQPSAAALYPGGSPPSPGTVLRRLDLAATLTDVAEHGRRAFYEGPVAAAVAASTDGIISTDDLRDNHPDWTDPIGIEVFGHHAWTIPPNSQGYLTLATCWAVEQLGPPTDADDPAFHHAVIEAYRAFAWERNDVVADPDHLPWELAHYLDTTRLRERLASISTDTAAARPQPSIGPPGTAYFCAVDAEGMAVSCIQSNYFGIGARISAGTTGVFLHNRGAGFSLLDGHPNEAGRGKRPLHTLAPTMWTRDGHPTLVLGTRGGDQQPQYLAQMAASMLYLGMDPEEAQAAPRWNISGDRSLPDSIVAVETGMPEEVVDGLRGRGHTVVAGPAKTPGWGPVAAIAIDPTGTLSAAADPRVSTATAAGHQ